MLLQHSILLEVLPFLLFLPFINADSKPYFRSVSYDREHYGAWPLQSYHSSSVSGLILNYWHRSRACEDGGFTLIAPRGDSVRHKGPMILDQNGDLVWFKEYGTTYNFNIHTFRGEDYLTFWAGNDGIRGHGNGFYYMLNSRYEEKYKISSVNGLPADFHEFNITPDGTAVFIVYETRPADLRIVGGPENGWIFDGVFQEVDIETNELLFQWRASEHFSLDDGYRGTEGNGDSQDAPWDFFHMNSIDKDARGNFLISSRYMSCLTYIDGKTGAVIWRLGGKYNSFADLSDGAATNISWQHHARFQEDNADIDPESEDHPKRAITIFDNSSRGEGAPENRSRGLFIDIDEKKLTARVRHEYWNPLPISSQSQGSTQLLDNGNVLVGYGHNAAWTEFSMDGEVLCDVHFGPSGGFGDGNILSYRVFKHHWVGRPRSSPDAAFAGTYVAVSWNGATEVKSWVLEGAVDTRNGSDGSEFNDWKIQHPEHLDEFVFVSAVPKSGFETVVPVPSDMPYRTLRVVAIGAEGEFLGMTATVEWKPEEYSKEILTVHGSEDDSVTESGQGDFWMFVVGSMTAALVMLCAWLIRICVREGSFGPFFGARTDREAKHEEWQSPNSQELNELFELSDSEAGDQPESHLLRKEDRDGIS
ncbi:uncharacterized protein N7511_000108 [Penicillium nucicola]|uniref:uncharacterized protein n=1 Tax=Penicillium nucicola TaxID=1850975 RepID=UPI002545A73E|nr:uncharacterized protein N7511_000108 [Penicillium nucicola]KAJ5775097.1 hypothetical protein N7511_000108 [Penicillium nucicola]